jgi:bacteriorhodopsin
MAFAALFWGCLAFGVAGLLVILLALRARHNLRGEALAPEVRKIFVLFGAEMCAISVALICSAVRFPYYFVIQIGATIAALILAYAMVPKARSMSNQVTTKSKRNRSVKT